MKGGDALLHYFLKDELNIKKSLITPRGKSALFSAAFHRYSSIVIDVDNIISLCCHTTAKLLTLVSKLKLLKANHTSQIYRLEDNIAWHYPGQISALKETIDGMQADIQTVKENLPEDKEQFSMEVGNIYYTDKKEAGTALVEMCREIKHTDSDVTIGEYAGLKMSAFYDSFSHKFVLRLKGRLRHHMEISSDPLGNITRINHTLESMPKRLADEQTKLANVERQFETAKEEVKKPFAREAELAEKLERLSVIDALLNMDEKGDDVIGMDDEQEEQSEGKNTKNPEELDAVPETDTKPAHRESLKERLEAKKQQVAAMDNWSVQKERGREEML